MQPEPGKSAVPESMDLLWEAFLAGDLDASGAATLLQHLEGNSEELQRRRADARMHACLSHLWESPEQKRPLVLSVQARLAGKKPYVSSGRFKQIAMTMVKRKSRQQQKRKHNAPWLRVLVPAAAAALLLIGILAILKWTSTEPAGPAKPNNIGTPAPTISEARLSVQQGRAKVAEHSHGPAESVSLPLHAKVSLESQSVAVVTLPDGSFLELSAQAELTVQGLDQGTRVRLEKGVALIQVTKQPAGKSFQVQSPFTTATVVGTRFTLEAYDRIGSVSVKEGSVLVSGPDAKHPPVLLAAGDEIRADPTGLGAPLRNAHLRVLGPNLGQYQPYTDPVRSSAISGETFRSFALQRLTCFSPNNPAAIGYCGWEWPVTLAPNETYVEMWFRPSKVVPRTAGKETPTLVMLANLGTTEYRIGEVQLSSADSGWLVLRGHLTGEAPVNWIKPGTERLPLQPDKVTQIVFRNEQADMEFDHSGLLIWGANP